VNQLTNAYKLSGKIVDEQHKMWSDFEATWYKSRLIKNQSVGGKDFIHEYDDVKDHFADRRKGLDYMLAPFERMQMEEWRQQLKNIVNGFAKLHNIPVKDLETIRLED
jgi:hypothetical protein